MFLIVISVSCQFFTVSYQQRKQQILRHFSETAQKLHFLHWVLAQNTFFFAYRLNPYGLLFVSFATVAMLAKINRSDYVNSCIFKLLSVL